MVIATAVLIMSNLVSGAETAKLNRALHIMSNLVNGAETANLNRAHHHATNLLLSNSSNLTIPLKATSNRLMGRVRRVGSTLTTKGRKSSRSEGAFWPALVLLLLVFLPTINTAKNRRRNRRKPGREATGSMMQSNVPRLSEAETTPIQ
jgi:hypothetical protein